MVELWSELVETLRRRPTLVLPVLVADLLCYLINLGRSALVHLLVLQRTAQHSALGGAVVHAPMTAAAAQSTTILVLLLSWLTYFFRVLLYTAALFATAAMLGRARSPFSLIGPTLIRCRSGLGELALRALAIYAVAALVLSWLSPKLVKAGHGAVLRNNWFNYGVTLLVLLVLSIALPPTALRVLLERSARRPLNRLAQQLAALLSVVAAGLSAFVNANARQLLQVPAAARYPLELIGSLVTALPYILLFVGLALLEQRASREFVEAA